SAEQDIRFDFPFSGRVALNGQYAFKRGYRLGFGVFYGDNNYVEPSTELAVGSAVTSYRYCEVGLELFQRIRIKAGGALLHNGLFCDLGVYGSRAWNRSERVVDNGMTFDNPVTTLFYNIKALQDYKWNYGVSARLVNDWYGIYANYRLNGLGKKVAPGEMLLPRLTIGLMLNF
ncbi:MAG: hypothetical protein SPJ13_03480, partial [Bacteroidales bacterium]|nr:hypothetical protein [Bacteroidales bacterium]